MPWCRSASSEIDHHDGVFLDDDVISRMMPIRPITDRSCPNSISARMADAADGSVDNGDVNGLS
jgi:hypothetical protein